MGKKLFVGNLPFSTSEDLISEAFSICGTVESVKIISDRETGRSKGFAFVEMSSDSEAADAINKMNGADHGGRNMIVSEARPMAPRNNDRGGGFDRPRGGGGGGGYGDRSRGGGGYGRGRD